MAIAPSRKWNDGGNGADKTGRAPEPDAARQCGAEKNPAYLNWFTISMM